MEGYSLLAIFKTSLEDAQDIIATYDLEATARRFGRFIAVYGPTIDDLGVEGVEAIARDKQLPLIACRKVRTNDSKQTDKAM